MEETKPLILFDGICNLCNGAVDFILKRDREKQFRFVSLQSEKGQELISQFNIPEKTDSVILIKSKRVFFESDAAIEIARMLPVPWKWLGIFRVFPVKFRNGIYRWIARNRYQWFGKRDKCRLIQN